MQPVAKIILHSCHEDGSNEVATIHARYWRPIHAEVMTHRVFGRNGRSSRAVPVKKLLREPIVEPILYGANIPGMSAGQELTGWRYLLARATWIGMAKMTRVGVRLLHFAGLHKQWANRPLEWFGCIDLLITSTQWANFFALRIDEHAQPEMRALAMAIRNALDASTPTPLKEGEWHLPFITADDWVEVNGGGIVTDEQIEALKKLSVARCARITYKPFDGNDSIEAEFSRYSKLVLNRPVHASPAEHQLTPDPDMKREFMHGCTPGWVQHRFEIPHHFIPG